MLCLYPLSPLQVTCSLGGQCLEKPKASYFKPWTFLYGGSVCPWNGPDLCSGSARSVRQLISQGQPSSNREYRLWIITLPSFLALCWRIPRKISFPVSLYHPHHVSWDQIPNKLFEIIVSEFALGETQAKVLSSHTNSEREVETTPIIILYMCNLMLGEVK